jgi:Tfp pilus assembly protein PilN
MRPVNLIPPDERGSDRSSMRTGAFSYVLIAALGLALLGMIALAFTSKQVNDRKSEVSDLQAQEQQAEAKAQSLQAFANFRAVQQQRSTTVTSLAQSRFDWQRVINELARVIPSNIWLVQLAGTANPQVTVPDAPEIQIRDNVTGPALELVGCATNQDAVAGFVSALEEIDGVTRVGLQSSGKADEANSISGASVSTGSGQETTTECRTNARIPKFEIVVAFDAVPTPSGAVTDPSVPSSLATTATASSQAVAQPTSSPSTGG